ncbi:hypothetical protein [Pseudofulvimonas gallinarii]|jgi:hypothetical protein|uniref:YtkA-like protein n=1 Tax=Pseudofulvimonas gallinarii TaxID=634155 RepID=A0A4R3LFS9_9GAMM|nr:hypothetical protein [Pseudofulvimonas gallinarii]TCS98899.1 hypothetical protein EDC25_10796 [Pseudofulvimonas gallinarii]
MNRIRPTALVLALAVAGLTACKKDEPAPAPAPAPSPAPAATPAPPPAPAAAPLAVADVQLGNALTESGDAVPMTGAFSPKDAIHAVVHTTGVGNATLGANWTYGADRQAVHQEEHRIDTDGPSRHLFRINMEDGFPTGTYQVDVTLDGNVVSSKSFSIE